jgi:hypothetical protein
MLACLRNANKLKRRIQKIPRRARWAAWDDKVREEDGDGAEKQLAEIA